METTTHVFATQTAKLSQSLGRPSRFDDDDDDDTSLNLGNHYGELTEMIKYCSLFVSASHSPSFSSSLLLLRSIRIVLTYNL